MCSGAKKRFSNQSLFKNDQRFISATTSYVNHEIIGCTPANEKNKKKKTESFRADVQNVVCSALFSFSMTRSV